MAFGGLRSVILGGLLLTVGLVPLTAGQETCVNAGPAELCVDDPLANGPLTHDAGEATIQAGDVSAEANGGVVTGAGSATFVLDYSADASGLSGDLRYVVQMVVYDGDGNIVEYNTTFGTIAPGEEVEDQLRIEIDTLTPLVDDGSIEVGASGEERATTRSTIGEAQSVSPITYVVAPPEDVADRTTVGQTIDVGSFDVGPNTEPSAQATDGEFLVAGDTGAKLQASGQLATRSFDGVDHLTQYTDADLRVNTPDFDVFVSSSVRPLTDSCFSSCSPDARTAEVDLSVVFPGDLEEPQREVEVRISGDWSANWQDPSTGAFLSDRASAHDLGVNELLALGP